MALDAQVEEYLTTLKTNVYKDGLAYKNGVDALKEMTFIAEALIKSRRIHYNKTKSFLNARLLRLGLLKDKISEFIEATQMQGKYDVFLANAKSQHGISNSMDQINANINVTIYSFLKKNNSYNREEEEINKRLSLIDNILNYYIDAKVTLEELRTKIDEINQQTQ